MLLIASKYDPTSFKVSINNHNISPRYKQKYLGVFLDHTLIWKPDINKVNTQRRACGILSKLKHYTIQSILTVITTY